MSPANAELDRLLQRSWTAGVPERTLDVLTDALAAGSLTTDAVIARLTALVSAEADPAPADGGFASGDSARVHGLQGRPDLNGQRVKLLDFSAVGGRWTVRCADGESVRVRPCNLEAAPAAAVPSGTNGEAAELLCEMDLETFKTGQEPELEFNMNPVVPEDLPVGFASCRRALEAVPRAKRRDTWFLFARRSHCWIGTEIEKKRMWWVVLVRPKGKSGRAAVAEAAVVDGPTLTEVATATLHPAVVAALLARVVESTGVAPARLAYGCFGQESRMRSAHVLGRAVATGLGPTILDVVAMACRDRPETAVRAPIPNLAFYSLTLIPCRRRDGVYIVSCVYSIWPLQGIRFVQRLCTRSNTIIRKHPPCLGTPPHPFTAYTIAQYSVSPDRPILQYLPYNIGNGNIV